MSKIKNSYPEIALAPINKEAALLMSKGVQFTIDRSHNTDLEWEICPPFKKAPWNCPNLIGQRSDRITIVGYFGFKKGSSGSKQGRRTSAWIGKCDCGRYVLRGGNNFRKSIKNKTSNCCTHCNYIKKITSPERRKYYMAKLSNIGV
jgi:hypothetical protein